MHFFIFAVVLNCKQPASVLVAMVKRLINECQCNSRGAQFWSMVKKKFEELLLKVNHERSGICINANSTS